MKKEYKIWKIIKRCVCEQYKVLPPGQRGWISGFMSGMGGWELYAETKKVKNKIITEMIKNNFQEMVFSKELIHEAFFI